MKNLLLVIDFQNDFVDGALGFPKASELDDGIARKIEQYRRHGDDVAFTFDTHTEDYLHTQEGRNLPVPHCIKGTKGWQLYGKVAGLIENSDARFEKGAFGSLELANHLARQSYGRIELVGLVSNICVISNAVLAKAALPQAEIVVDASNTASHDEHLHEAALDVMAGLQMTIINR